MAMSNQLHTLATLPLGRKYMHSTHWIIRNLDGDQSHSGCFTAERNFLLLLGIEHCSLSCPAHGIVSIPTEQTQLGEIVLMKLALEKLKKERYVSGAGIA
jgi:hypothetical protein